MTRSSKREGLKMEKHSSIEDGTEESKNYRSESVNKEFSEDHEVKISNIHDNDCEEICKNQYNKRKAERSKSARQKNNKSSRKEFIGWGTRSLIEFLASIGKDTSVTCSQQDVASIVNNYIKENKLLVPENKKKVKCDGRLQSLFGRKTIHKNKIYNLLESHFAENQDDSEENESGKNPQNDQKRTFASTEPANQDKNTFASIEPANMKHLYLKRSLLLELSKQPGSFEEKAVGSFVRVRSDPNDSQKHSHQLVQVKGIKKNSVGENNTKIILQASPVLHDIPLKLLSDGDLTKEECGELRQKMMDGEFAWPTLKEFEDKARLLREDIIKHWISKELHLLNILIDQANEKGWRNQFFKYWEKREMLQSPKVQLALLNEVPLVIPDLVSVHQSGDKANSGRLEENQNLGMLDEPDCEPLPAAAPSDCTGSAETDEMIRPVITKVYSRRKKPKTDSLGSAKEPLMQRKEWYVVEKSGKKVYYSLSLLKGWSELNPDAFKFHVCQKGEPEEKSIRLEEAFSLANLNY